MIWLNCEARCASHAKSAERLPIAVRNKRSLTKLALEVHWTSNLSEFPLRVAFARYALSAKAVRSAHK
ncbi:hypothetical protein CG401_01640 [Bifidobacteriaceae bacterium NR019]|nr:hypothetical protein CG401_01640 [Bifidobacteriaceae bacterium NR019]RFT36428.1 hypothetical protein CG400_00510 [Bifidobacteriaceae bacterium NR017]